MQLHLLLWNTFLIFKMKLQDEIYGTNIPVLRSCNPRLIDVLFLLQENETTDTSDAEYLTIL